jgi:hypothetical protein
MTHLKEKMLILGLLPLLLGMNLDSTPSLSPPAFEPLEYFSSIPGQGLLEGYDLFIGLGIGDSVVTSLALANSRSLTVPSTSSDGLSIIVALYVQDWESIILVGVTATDDTVELYCGLGLTF